MGYESDPLPSYLRLRKGFYYIMLSYAVYPSTTQVHLPRPGPTISPSGSSPESAPPWLRVHRWGGRPTFPLWLPVVSWCTILWGELPRLTLPPTPGGIPNPRPPHVSPSSPWSALPPGDGIPPRPLEYPLSPTNFHWLIRAPTVSPTYKSSPGPAPLLPYLPAPSNATWVYSVVCNHSIVDWHWRYVDQCFWNKWSWEF